MGERHAHQFTSTDACGSYPCDHGKITLTRVHRRAPDRPEVFGANRLHLHGTCVPGRLDVVDGIDLGQALPHYFIPEGAGCTFAGQQAQIAAVATRLFGTTMAPQAVIGETLRRVTPEPALADPVFVEKLRSRVQADTPPPEEFSAFCADPLCS